MICGELRQFFMVKPVNSAVTNRDPIQLSIQDRGCRQRGSGIIRGVVFNDAPHGPVCLPEGSRERVNYGLCSGFFLIRREERTHCGGAGLLPVRQTTHAICYHAEEPAMPDKGLITRIGESERVLLLLPGS